MLLGPPGSVRIDVAVGAGVRILVTAPGYRPVWSDAYVAEEEPDERRVVLRAGSPVRPRPAVRPPTERNGGTALLSLRHVAPEPQDYTGAFDTEVPLDLVTDGEALVVFPGPGTYRLGLSKRWMSQDGTPYGRCRATTRPPRRSRCARRTRTGC